VTRRHLLLAFLLFAGAIALAQDDGWVDWVAPVPAPVPIRDAFPALDDPRPDTRPVAAAFNQISREWKQRLCYEDAALDARWARIRGLGAAGVPADSIRTLELKDITMTTTEEVAASVLQKSEAASGLVRFRIQDVGGCTTAIPVERRMSDGVSWEAVVPVLDRQIFVEQPSTYRTALLDFVHAMNATGVDISLNDGGTLDAPCSLKSGERIARDVLGDILRCSPWPSAATFSIQTPDGVFWMLNVPGGTIGSSGQR